MAKKRDYRAEYRRRIERGLERGLSRSLARGHAKAAERKAKTKPPRADKPISDAVREMNRGSSLTAAARANHVSAERLRGFLAFYQLGGRKGRRWVTHDDRARRLPVLTGGQFRVLTLAGYEQARLVGEHHNAAGEFVRTNDVQLLMPFKDRYVRSTDGTRYRLETDPNALHRIAAMDTPPFHEIYEITTS